MVRFPVLCAALFCGLISSVLSAGEAEKHFLYVGLPGIRDYVAHGGEGILVYDIDRQHAFVKRIPTPIQREGKAEAMKGICAHAGTRKLYFSTPTRLICIDLLTDKPVWEKTPAGGCDRMSIAPDGKVLFVPSFEGPHWNVIDGETGDTVAKVETKSGSHNTVCGLDGSRAYMAGLKSNILTVADARTHTVLKTVGPFSAQIRPFTVNGGQTLCFACVNELLGFEVGDLNAGKMIHRVEVPGFAKGEVKRHGCPSHGVGLTPDEKEVWVTDMANSSLHIFDNTVRPPAYKATVRLSDQPGRITFSIDGRFAYPSTGDVVDVQSRKIVTALKEEHGQPVQSEKLLEIDFSGGVPCRAGDQFGIGRVAPK